MKCSLTVLVIVQWGHFNDGFPDLFICGVKRLPRHHVGFLASFHDRNVIFEQLSAIYSLPRYLARSFTVIMPYYPTGTMERIQRLGEVATVCVSFPFAELVAFKIVPVYPGNTDGMLLWACCAARLLP